MKHEHAQSLLNEFGKNFDLPELSFDANGYCCLFFDEIAVNMELDEEGKTLFFYANLGETPQDRKTELYEMLLEANYFYKHTNGAALGIDKDSHTILLIYRMSIQGLDLMTFQQILENFINISESWIEKIKRFATELPETTQVNNAMIGIRV